ncbi:short-chain dehydrogenase [Rhodopirellula sp. SM50]|nr:SDR family oxidoreductase [Rhodopirellula sp. SM50]PAY19333.1 short-chain dehydrogenase [Rhodopirellula sp. SM50]
MSLIDKLFRLDGRVAVVNGGAGRIGSRIAEVLVSAGAHVAILDLDEAAGRQQVERISQDLDSDSRCGTCHAYVADSTDPESLQAAQQQIEADLGAATILFNATQFRGTGFYGSDPADHPLDAWNKVMEVNVTGVLLACQTFHRSMKSQGGGAIINLSSTYGVVSADPRIYGDSGVNSPVSYGTSKSAVLNMTRYLAVHWREHGIRVNCLVPGGVFDNQGEEFVKNYSSRTPLGRMARADEYQGAALFMASPASSYMTGSIVTVDGGWTAW